MNKEMSRGGVVLLPEVNVDELFEQQEKQAAQLDQLQGAQNVAAPMCGCGKRFATVVGPDKQPLCSTCAWHLATKINRERKANLRAARRNEAMAIPKGRR